MNVYTDSSALMRRYLSRPGAPETDFLLDQADRRGTAALTRIEVAAALRRLNAGGVVSKAELLRGLTALEDDLAHFWRIAISQEVLDEAYRISAAHRLKGYDAVQLGAATVWQATLREPVVVATFDHQLWAAAAGEGFGVWPEDLDAFRSAGMKMPPAGQSKQAEETEITA